MSDVAALQAQTAAAAQAAGLPANIFLSLINSESSFNPLAVGQSTSSGTALGIAQLMPGTAADLGVTNAFDPSQALPAAANYLKSLFRKYGNWTDAIAAYKGSPSSSLAQSQAKSVITNAAQFGTGDTGNVTNDSLTLPSLSNVWEGVAQMFGLGPAIDSTAASVQAAKAAGLGTSFFQKYGIIALEILLVVGLIWFAFSSLLQSTSGSANIATALKLAKVAA
jgi:hypothetical protein